MQFSVKLAVTGSVDAVSKALNAIDDRLVRDGFLQRGDSCFRFWKPSHRNADGTTTSFFSTWQVFAADWLKNKPGVSAETV